MKPVVIGTRGSALALWQARHVAGWLREAHPDLEIVEKIIHSEGDLNPDVPIATVGNTGVFVKRLETALLGGDIDLAVHSLKDLPTEQPEGLTIAAVPVRHDPRDALVSTSGWTLTSLPRNATLGTGSPRRRCQLLHARADLDVLAVRGNVDTRVSKVRSGELDAVVLAVAGLERLEIADVKIEPLDPGSCLPAAGQGALGIEIRDGDARILDVVKVLDHPRSAIQVAAERACLRRLGGGCLAPATAFASTRGDRLLVEALVGDLDGGAILLEREEGLADSAERIGARLAERLLVAGAEPLLERARMAQEHDRPA